MYVKTPHRRRTLITAQEVIKRASTTVQLDPLKLDNAVEPAEIRFIYRQLGGVYTALVAAKNRTVDAGNKVALQALFTAQHAGGQVPTLQVGDVVNAREFLTLDQLELWDLHLWKYAAEAVITQAMPANFAEFSSQGLLKNNPVSSSLATESSKSVGVTLSELKFMLDNQLQQVLDPLREGLHDYLCSSLARFPLYSDRCATCSQDEDPSKSTSWVNIYDDPTPGRCCD